MDSVVSRKAYVPVPPYHGTLWPRALNFYFPRFLRRQYGTTRIDIVGAEKIRASIAAGCGILITPNHCRDQDAIVMSPLARAVGRPVFLLASAHAFTVSRRRAFWFRRAGAFSIDPDGNDKRAVQTAIEIVATAERPLVIFPEGHTSGTNDRIGPMFEGTALIARQAAKRRAREGKRVVVHPVAMRYAYLFDVPAAAGRMLDEIEARLDLRPTRDRSLHERVQKVELELLAVTERQHLGLVQGGGVAERIDRLIEAILAPLEHEWNHGIRDGSVAARVKRLRAAMNGEKSDAAPAPRRALEDVELVEKLSLYPPDYVVDGAPIHRLMEMIERFEQGLTGRMTVHGPMGVTVTVGDAIEVGTSREARGKTDPLMAGIDAQLRAMLGLSSEDEGRAHSRIDVQKSDHS